MWVGVHMWACPPLERQCGICTIYCESMSKIFLVKERTKSTAWSDAPPLPIELRRVDDVDGQPAYEMAFFYTFCYDTSAETYVCKDLSRKKAIWTRAYKKHGNPKSVFGLWTYSRSQPGARSEFDRFKIVDKI